MPFFQHGHSKHEGQRGHVCEQVSYTKGGDNLREGYYKKIQVEKEAELLIQNYWDEGQDGVLLVAHDVEGEGTGGGPRVGAAIEVDSPGEEDVGPVEEGAEVGKGPGPGEGGDARELPSDASPVMWGPLPF